MPYTTTMVKHNAQCSEQILNKYHKNATVGMEAKIKVKASGKCKAKQWLIVGDIQTQRISYAYVAETSDVYSETMWV